MSRDLCACGVAGHELHRPTQVWLPISRDPLTLLFFGAVTQSGAIASAEAFIRREIIVCYVSLVVP